MENQKKKGLLMLASVVIVIVLYVFFHEMGHCIVAIACGADITEFSILSAHMSYVGGSFTDTSDLWLHANGMVFPLILSYVFMLCYQKEKESTFYRFFAYMAVLAPTCSALAWVVIPIVYLQGNAPAGDDVTKFLQRFSTRYHPIYVTFGAIVLIAVSVILMIKKRIIQNAVMELKGKVKGDGMRKKVIVASSILVIVLVALMCFLFIKRNVYEVEFEKDISVQDSVVQEEELEYEIVIPRDGEYVMYANWQISPAGLLTGCSIKDENGEDVNTFSAECIDMRSAVMRLTAGRYTMTLTFISSGEQWKEYFADFDTTDWDVTSGEEPQYQFLSDGVLHFNFDFRLEKHIDIWITANILAALIGVMLAILLIAVTQTGDDIKQHYDERQELLRSRGRKYALYTMLILDILLFLGDVVGIYLPMSVGFASFLCALVGIGVYAVYCIWNNVYFALNQKAGAVVAVLVLVGAVNLIGGISALVEGKLMQNNELTLRSLNLLCGIMIFVICGALILKKVCKDREEE